MESKIYFKVVNKNWENRDMGYCRGLNTINCFEENGSCVPGRIYFCDPSDSSQNICRYLHMGDLLVDVTLPVDDSEFKMIIDPSGGKTCANKIIIGKDRQLSDPETFRYMASHGVDIKKNTTLSWACEKKYWDVILYLLKMTAITESRFYLVNKVLPKKLEFSANEKFLLANIEMAIYEIKKQNTCLPESTYVSKKESRNRPIFFESEKKSTKYFGERVSKINPEIFKLSGPVSKNPYFKLASEFEDLKKIYSAIEKYDLINCQY
ncbi:ankyrin repeat protein [Moumouvirus australiensis]|uniref:Ankyrin repeat protein n=1 Tax=Moumouvirus australiensis TaxID=2109587 RepID=A0A2P1EMU9_9VIRU|nr:ankyrin repeat protein [Moumouvirus australiensis]AVL95211.1 ankyrin repeat protein [Moumouvirus australiensis]